MAIRVVYLMDNKSPDVVEGAETWRFGDGTLKIWARGANIGGGDSPMVEISSEYVLSVEQVGTAIKDVDAPKAPEAPEEAPKGPANTP